jgi:protein-S-isoprenylcysteine O-methyltransferase Ste14
MDVREIFRVWLPLVLGAFALREFFISDIGPHGPMRWVGLALAVIGFAGVIVSRYTLGRSFSVRAKATALVTTGIYARIRNPIYISGEVTLIGIAVMMWRWEFFVFLAVIIPLQFWRAHNEARVLEEKFGDEYREYRRRTWF